MKKIGFAADEMVKIIDAHFAPMLLYARQWDATVAEDLVQEALLKLLRHSQTASQLAGVAVALAGRRGTRRTVRANPAR